MKKVVEGGHAITVTLPSSLIEALKATARTQAVTQNRDVHYSDVIRTVLSEAMKK